MECTVKRNAVILFIKLLLNGGVCQCVLVFQKQMEYIGAAFSFAQSVVLEDLVKFVHRHWEKHNHPVCCVLPTGGPYAQYVNIENQIDIANHSLRYEDVATPTAADC